MALAEVKCSCGRFVLEVAGVVVAMQGDPCRQMLPPEITEPIPEWELECGTIGGKSIKDMPRDVVQFFRGENWREESLKWAAKVINDAVAEGGE